LSSVPEPVARAAALFSTYPKPWCLAGGWASDAWLGHETRAHGDIDIVIFEPDQRTVFDHLAAGWDMVGHDANVNDVFTEPWGGESLLMPAHVHCRPSSPGRVDLFRWITPPFSGTKDGNDLELVLNELEGTEWVLRSEPRIALPLEEAMRMSPWGLPTLAPEYLVFYKATAYVGNARLKNRPQDQADSEVLAPLLSEAAKAWLRKAFEQVPHHPWAAQLAE
jgi:hypothetical protein